MVDLIGQSIGRYQITAKLGEGGMAIVFRGHDMRLQRDVAIKLIRIDMFPPAILHNILERFEREAQALARMDHPNIVHLYDYGELEDAPYLVMEFLPGGTLRQRLGKPLPFREAAALLAPVARALEYAHCENVIHRDIKPANVLFTRRNVPKISDFGIAKLLGMDEATTLTSTGMAMGTPAYMAPEQWSGETSPAVDVYALGIVFYEMLTGKPPYQANTPADLFAQVLTQPLPDPRQVVIDLSQDVTDVLKHALAKQPADRYQEMAALASDLESIANPSQVETPTEYLSSPRPPGKNMSVTSSEPQPIHNLPTLALGGEPSPGIEKAGPASRSKNRRHWLVGGGITLLLLLGIFGGWTAWQRSQASALPTETGGAFAAAILPSRTPTTSKTPEPSITPSLTESPSTPTPTVTETKIVTPTVTDNPLPTLMAGATRTLEKDGMIQVYIPAGEFWMGAEPNQYNNMNNLTPHRVYLDAFWMDQIEVTNGMYQRCVRDGACLLPDNDRSNTRISYYGEKEFAYYPVIYVSWQDAMDYCNWAERSLPSEAQWEKAARGMLDMKMFPWGNDWPACIPGGITSAQYNECSLDDTVAVGSYGANGYGLYDMAGNVWEWVADWALADYYSTYARDTWPANPTGPTSGIERIKRGGSWTAENWGNVWEHLVVSNRSMANPNQSNNNTGFRCVSTVEP